MQKKLSFIQSDLADSSLLEERLCELILHGKFEEAGNLCLEIAQEIRGQNPDIKHMVVTDINPLLIIANSDSKKILSKMSHKKLPLSADGLVVMQDNLNPASVGRASNKFLGNMPSWQQSLHARRDRCSLITSNSKEAIKQLLQFYRSERDTDLLSEEALINLISRSSFSFSKVHIWGAFSHENQNSDSESSLFTLEAIFESCFEVLGVNANLAKQLNGEKPSMHDYMGFKNKAKCADASKFLLKCLNRKNQKILLADFILNKISYFKLSDVEIQGQLYPRHAYAGGVGFGVSSGFLPSVLDYLCVTLSGFTGVKPERIFAEVIEGALLGKAKGFRFFGENQNTELSVSACSRELSKKGIMPEAFSALRWNHLIADIDNRGKKQILTNELGL